MKSLKMQSRRTFGEPQCVQCTGDLLLAITTRRFRRLGQSSQIAIDSRIIKFGRAHLMLIHPTTEISDHPKTSPDGVTGIASFVQVGDE